MRSYELAREEGIQFLVYGNLDFFYRKGGYDPRIRCGHYDGKGRVGEWILQQNKEAPKDSNEMGAALFTTGPYMSMAVGARTPVSPTVEDGVITSLADYWAGGPLGRGIAAAGYNAEPDNPATMAIRDSLTGFWNMWKRWRGDQGERGERVIQRDFSLLDENSSRQDQVRARAAPKGGGEQRQAGLWTRVNHLQPVLKIAEDGRQGRL